MNMTISIEKTKSVSSGQNHRASLTIQISGYGSVELSRPSEEPKKPDQQSVCQVGLLKAENMGERKHVKG